MERLARLFALSNIENFGLYFVQFNILSTSGLNILKDNISKVMKEIRPQVIGLTDSFKLSDFFINSVLGSYNGDIYNNYLETVKSLDSTDDGKPPYAKEFLEMLNRGSVEEREKGEKRPEILKKLSGGEGNDDDDDE